MFSILHVRLTSMSTRESSLCSVQVKRQELHFFYIPATAKVTWWDNRTLKRLSNKTRVLINTNQFPLKRKVHLQLAEF